MIISEAALMEPKPLIVLSDDELESVILATEIPLRAHVCRDRLKAAINELAWPTLTDTFPVLYPVKRLELLDRVVAVIDEYLADERYQREYDEPPPIAAPLSAWATETKSWLRTTRQNRRGRPAGTWTAEFDVRALALFAAAFEIGAGEPPTTYEQPGNNGDGSTVRFFKALLKALQHRARKEGLLLLDAKHVPMAGDLAGARNFRILKILELVTESAALASRIKNAREAGYPPEGHGLEQRPLYQRLRLQYARALRQGE
ncbi:hypothetical protein ACLI1C_18820 [Devosia sp. XGJD_8]|uniref:hypothetical protein n=1 Tax=Devosia sp. XGJD_8 TaxID=3391187 RepID=UPI0039854137